MVRSVLLICLFSVSACRPAEPKAEMTERQVAEILDREFKKAGFVTKISGGANDHYVDVALKDKLAIIVIRKHLTPELAKKYADGNSEKTYGVFSYRAFNKDDREFAKQIEAKASVILK